MSKKFGFGQNFWKYLFVVIAPIVVWYSVFNFVYRIKDNEQVKILFWGNDMDVLSLSEDLNSQLQNITDNDKLKKVTVDKISLNDNFGQLVLAYQSVYDIIVFSEDFLTENIGQNYGFVYFNSEDFEKYFGEATAYSEQRDESTLYYAAEFSSESIFANYYSGEEKCYMFFSPNSVNLGGYADKGEAADDGAFKIAQYLLKNFVASD